MAQPTNLQVNGDNSGAIYTVQLNEILSAHSTMFAGNTEPLTIVANMVWQDTSVDPPRFWRRNATNSAWNLMGQWNNGTFTGNVTGASGSTAKLTTPRAIAVSGDATGSVSFDGSANATIPVTLANSGVVAGTYGSATQVAVPTVDSKGRITAMANQTISFPAQAMTSWNGRTGAVTLNTTDVFNVLPAKTDRGDGVLSLNRAGTAIVWKRPYPKTFVPIATGSGQMGVTRVEVRTPLGGSGVAYVTFYNGAFPSPFLFIVNVKDNEPRPPNWPTETYSDPILDLAYLPPGEVVIIDVSTGFELILQGQSHGYSYTVYSAD
jgi:hypothetical protein